MDLNQIYQKLDRQWAGSQILSTAEIEFVCSQLPVKHQTNPRGQRSITLENTPRRLRFVWRDNDGKWYRQPES